MTTKTKPKATPPCPICRGAGIICAKCMTVFRDCTCGSPQATMCAHPVFTLDQKLEHNRNLSPYHPDKVWASQDDHLSWALGELDLLHSFGTPVEYSLGSDARGEWRVLRDYNLEWVVRLEQLDQAKNMRSYDAFPWNRFATVEEAVAIARAAMGRDAQTVNAERIAAHKPAKPKKRNRGKKP